MSGIDLSAAVEAAARGWFESAPFAPPWDDMNPVVKHRAMETTLPGIIAAAPIIEAQIREQIARDIEAYADAMWDLIDSNNGARIAFETIASIARGVTS